MYCQKNKPAFNITDLAGVGKQIAKHLARLNIHTIEDLLLHLPLRYQDRTQIQPIGRAQVGQEIVVEGVIQKIETGRGRTKLVCQIKDETGSLCLRFFHVLSFQNTLLKIGQRLRCFSELRFGPKGKEMVHPEFQVIYPNKALSSEQHLTPIYPGTEGISQYTLRKLTMAALNYLKDEQFFPEILPKTLLEKFALPSFSEALCYLHHPPQSADKLALEERRSVYHQRLVFEELLAHRLSLLHLKQCFQAEQSFLLTKPQQLIPAFLKQLPFALTKAQERVVKEINADLEKPQPMLRLVQGDVGSGKTVVACLAILKAIENGYQAAFMAPTELLAEQHVRVCENWFAKLSIKVVCLTSNSKGRIRQKVLEEIASGTAQVIIGTHALFQKEIKFAKLALIVIDEQHRFGVHQRASLREKGVQENDYPHQLIMTATPIPRTLAMSFYADLDCSTIDSLPPGRTPIVTSVLSNEKREEVIARIRAACQENAQVYWVCPLIEESEALACQAATLTASQLQAALPELKVGLIHGRLSANEKKTIMQTFKEGVLHILVATTVIEVGVDVPNASVMIVENAERLGLAQLHQLRGRVGRGSAASYCILLYQQPLSAIAKDRLIVMRETTDGFKIAQRDLELRGPGEILGVKQTGELSFYTADLLRDKNLLPSVQQAASMVMQDHPEIIQPLFKRWFKGKATYIKV